MLREIKYVCTQTPDVFTCHSIFSKVTDCSLKDLNVNAYSKSPEFLIYSNDRVVVIIVNDEDLKIAKNLPVDLELNHNGGTLKAVLLSDKEYVAEPKFKEGDFVCASGVISFARSLSKPEIITAENSQNGKIGKRNKISPMTPFGNFKDGERQRTLKYLEDKIGLNLNDPQVDSRQFRFEMISYKHFEKKFPVLSKTNKNKLSLHDVFFFSVVGFVKDAEKANSLQFTSIGRKRSYGLGVVDLSLVSNVKEEEEEEDEEAL